ARFRVAGQAEIGRLGRQFDRSASVGPARALGGGSGGQRGPIAQLPQDVLEQVVATRRKAPRFDQVARGPVQVRQQFGSSRRRGRAALRLPAGQDRRQLISQDHQRGVIGKRLIRVPIQACFEQLF